MTDAPVTGAPVDLRSDTVALPSPGMRAAMAEAELGDDMFGEDPTVRALEERLCGLFGFSGALFAPSGVMANQIGLRLLVGPGEELVCDAEAHILAHEDGAPALHGGIQTRTLTSESGLIDPRALAAFVRRGNSYTVGTRAVAVEQTHTRSGGNVHPLETLRGIRAVADAAGIAVHLDGARIWNAHAATGVPLAEFGAPVADTLSVCLSKGLGAPVGSVLLCDGELLGQARKIRHRLGGGMRQAGVLAAAGLYALEHNLARIGDDHSNAALLADGLREAGCAVSAPETNIVLARTPAAEAVVEQASRHGVRVTSPAPGLLRLVTHLDVDKAGCEQAVRVLAKAIHGQSAG
ncbi:Threonine aldolase [Frankia canadensis]|uniref:Threonine aldolase n=1 Tax=Frankia canadensis TaxID=1836972 RepID=A0A2I2L279_9ACTN|nr:GntG family PLP-dependent aldolase [Frankia canadensis]SNQ52022.1 Threonine aldolase [Frankia canadensis]SOU59312.1 Threonine aldolase [Frankia canadensis]